MNKYFEIAGAVKCPIGTELGDSNDIFYEIAIAGDALFGW